MNRFGLSLLASLALGAAFQGSASAQTGTPTGTSATAFTPNIEVRIDGSLVKNEAVAFVRRAQCQEGVEFSFKLTNLPSVPINNLEMWVSAGTGTDCTSSANRTVNANTPNSQCWFIKSASQVAGSITFEAEATDIFREGSGAEAKRCPDKAGDKYNVYFVPLETSTESNSASPPMPTININRTATFSLYTAAPNAPGGIKGQNGEYDLTLRWSKPAGAVATSTYRAYFDTSVGADSTCAGSVLKAGGAIPKVDNITIFSSGTEKGTNASIGDLDERGVSKGEYVAAAVVHRDFAKNDSALSEVACIQRVDVETFPDACADDPDCADGFDSCSVSSPGLRSGGPFGLTLLIGLGVALRARRRRHV